MRAHLPPIWPGFQCRRRCNVWVVFFLVFFSGAHFWKVLVINLPGKLFCLHSRLFFLNSFAVIMVKLSVNKNIVTKPNLEEFLRKLFEQYRIENCGKQYWICVATDRFLFFIFYFPILFIFIVICFVTYWHIYLLIDSFTFCCVLKLLICCQ